LKAEKIMELLETSEKLISNIKTGVQERQEGGYIIEGIPGRHSNSNLKDKIRVARGMLMEVSNGLEWESFRD